jgi:integrative and conjugative element protein (TIGR02256 family)
MPHRLADHGNPRGHGDSASRTHVTAILGPSPDSDGSPGAFHRGCVGYPEALDEVLAQTAGIIRYVGEWHVHPEGAPFPSATDRVAMRRSRAELTDPSIPALCIILGAAERIGAWIEPSGGH